MNDEIGTRVRGLIQNLNPARADKDIAQCIGMTRDAFSRSVAGQRAFSSIELAELADQLSADVHWLITGKADPRAASIAARHDWVQGEWSNPGRAQDQSQLDDIVLAYRQADDGQEIVPSVLPKSAQEFREKLGSDFVREFVDRLESTLNIDVVRLPALSTSYCMSIANRRIIILAATPNWFRENWSLAHEIGHLACGHLESERDESSYQQHEAEASRFAADLLMPAEEMSRLSWVAVQQQELASRVWELGVSLDALINRIRFLNLPVDETVLQWDKGQPTQRLLRWHWQQPDEGLDPITRRMDEAASRRFPVGLQEAHLKAIDTGRLGASTLAWMMNVDPRTLEADAPTVEVADDALADVLGI